MKNNIRKTVQNVPWNKFLPFIPSSTGATAEYSKSRSKLLNLTRTLRGRLTLWYLISVLLIELIFLFVVSGLFWFTLQDQIDHHIHIAVNEAKEVVENYRGEERDNLIKSLVSAKGMTVVVLSADGSPILETNSPDVAFVTEHQLQKLMGSNNLYDSNPAHFTENNIRFAATPVTVNAGKGIVAVGYSTQVLYETLYKIVAVVLVLITLMLLVALYGYKLLRKELLPLEKIATQAKAVTDTSFLAKRISTNSTTQEIKTIQESLNSMLSQLENIFGKEREFFSDAAHTLKTPLAVLRSQIENTSMPQKSRFEMLKIIDRASETVGDLLFLSIVSGKSQKNELISLSDMAEDVSELATTLAEDKNLTVKSDIQKDITINADRNLLQRALNNIVYNAVVYNKPGGSIFLTLTTEPRLITIKIKDTGIGISKKDLPGIFNRFYRGTNVSVQGSGLGLAISKAVIENFGGKINIISKLNRGTTVVVTFS